VEVWRKKIARGDVIVVRYADDAVLGFQYREDAERFRERGDVGMVADGGEGVSLLSG